jgi:hypothetical protein
MMENSCSKKSMCNECPEDDYCASDCEEDTCFASMNNCDCPEEPQCSNNLAYAHIFIPKQNYTKAFTPDVALKRGTLFPELWNVYPIPK